MLATYWCEHPFACDTPEGIRYWWLPDGFALSHEHVATALTFMVNLGAIEELPAAADGRIRYRRRPHAADDALRLLAADPSSGFSSAGR